MCYLLKVSMTRSERPLHHGYFGAECSETSTWICFVSVGQSGQAVFKGVCTVFAVPCTVYSTHLLTTSHRCCISYIGWQFRDKWSLRLPALCTCHWHQKCRRTSLPTFERGCHSLRSSSNRTLAVPRTRSSFGDRSFAAVGPRLWNSLPY